MIARKGLSAKSPLRGTSSLNRGNSRLSTNTRIRGHASSSGRIIDGKKIWSLDEADRRMSQYIRQRDGRCMKCGAQDLLTNSHYHNSWHKATAYDPKNLICLCVFCHSEWEDDKTGEYKTLMIELIGQEEFAFLEARAKTTVKKEDMIIECMRFLEKEEKEGRLSVDITF